METLLSLDIDWGEFLINILLAGVAFAVILSLWRAHNSPHYKDFNLLNIFTTPSGQPDRPALMEVTVWVLMCWGFVVFVTRGTLSDWYVYAFVGAFVARAGHSAWLRSKMEKKEE